MKKFSPLIVANWKMQLTPTAAVSLAKKIAARVPRGKTRVVLCPSFPALREVGSMIRGRCDLGSQDLFFVSSGAYTGAVSIPMLKDLGCRYAIIGHSERRTFFHETDLDIQKKFDATMAAHIIPIVCVGETKRERQQRRSEQVIRRELRTALAHGKRFSDKVVIAYEPIWAIGGARAADPKLISAMHKIILRECRSLLSKRSFAALDVLYGGSVAPANVTNYVGSEKMQGVLVGGASLAAKSFLGIISAATK